METNLEIVNYSQKLKVGDITKTGFKLTQKIDTIDELLIAIDEDKSIFARHKMYPPAFFMNWKFRTIKEWIDAGWFFRASRAESNKNNK